MTSRPPSSADARGAPRALACGHRSRRRRLPPSRSASGAHRGRSSDAPTRHALEAWADAGIALRADGGLARRAAGAGAVRRRAAGPAAARAGRRRSRGPPGASLRRRARRGRVPARAAGGDRAPGSAARCAAPGSTAALAVPPRAGGGRLPRLPARARPRRGAGSATQLLAAWRARRRRRRAPRWRRSRRCSAPSSPPFPRPHDRMPSRWSARVADAFPAGVPALLRSLPRLYDGGPADASGRVGGPRARHRGAPSARPASRSSASRRAPSERVLDGVAHERRRSTRCRASCDGWCTCSPARPPRRVRSDRSACARRSRTIAGERHGRAAAGDRPARRPSRTTRGSTGCWRRCSRDVASIGTYEALPDGASALRPPGRPAALEPLFLLADGVRVAARLAAAYPGSHAELRWAAGEIAGRARRAAGSTSSTRSTRSRCSRDASSVRVPPWLAALRRGWCCRACAPLAAPGRDRRRRAPRRRAPRAPLSRTPRTSDEGLGVLPDLVTVLLDAGAGDALPGGGDDGAGGAPGGARRRRRRCRPPSRTRSTLLVDEQLGDAGGTGFPLDADDAPAPDRDARRAGARPGAR